MRAPALLAAALLLTGAARAEAVRFDLPIACEIGTDCWVQQYVDHDPSTGVKDYACGAQTYDGHDGTDIRIRDTAAKATIWTGVLLCLALWISRAASTTDSTSSSGAWRPSRRSGPTRTSHPTRTRCGGSAGSRRR